MSLHLCSDCGKTLPEDDDAVWHAGNRWFCSETCAKRNQQPRFG